MARKSRIARLRCSTRSAQELSLKAFPRDSSMQATIFAPRCASTSANAQRAHRKWSRGNARFQRPTLPEYPGAEAAETPVQAKCNRITILANRLTRNSCENPKRTKRTQGNLGNFTALLTPGSEPKAKTSIAPKVPGKFPEMRNCARSNRHSRKRTQVNLGKLRKHKRLRELPRRRVTQSPAADT